MTRRWARPAACDQRIALPESASANPRGLGGIGHRIRSPIDQRLPSFARQGDMADIEQLKVQANAAFSSGRHEDAAALYTAAIEACEATRRPDLLHILHSNR